MTVEILASYFHTIGINLQNVLQYLGRDFQNKIIN